MCGGGDLCPVRTCKFFCGEKIFANMKMKQKNLLICPLKPRGGGLKALADMSAKYVSFFGRLHLVLIMHDQRRWILYYLFRYVLLDTFCWIRFVGYVLLDTFCWIRFVGYVLLDTFCWIRFVGYVLLDTCLVDTFFLVRFVRRICRC